MVHTYPTAAALSAAAAEVVAGIAHAAVAARGRFTIALTGGRSPRGLYELMATGFADRIPWAGTEFYIGDERWVPHDDPLSNYGMARATVFATGRADPARVHPIDTAHPSPDASARAYEALLRARAPEGLDLALLGMGPDGHTASLFPGAPALDEPARSVVGVDAPTHIEPHVPRVTMTLPYLNAARVGLFLVTGVDKREVLRAVLAGDTRYPAARVRPRERLLWLVDDGANPGIG